MCKLFVLCDQLNKTQQYAIRQLAASVNIGNKDQPCAIVCAALAQVMRVDVIDIILYALEQERVWLREALHTKWPFSCSNPPHEEHRDPELRNNRGYGGEFANDHSDNDDEYVVDHDGQDEYEDEDEYEEEDENENEDENEDDDEAEDDDDAEDDDEAEDEDEDEEFDDDDQHDIHEVDKHEHEDEHGHDDQHECTFKTTRDGDANTEETNRVPHRDGSVGPDEENEHSQTEQDVAEEVEKAYTCLGADATWSAEALRKHYLKLVREYHPDKHSSASSAQERKRQTDMFVQVNKAYNTLKYHFYTTRNP